MSTTANLGLVLLEVGQKEKEVTINTNFTQIDAKIVRYLGELAADPVIANIAFGSTYFNTASNKLKVLKTSGTWANAA